MATIYQPEIGSWRYGLFECFDSIGDCCASYWCAPCYAAYAANVAQENIFSSALQCLCYPLGLCFLRPKIRSDLGIEGSIISDILSSCCCPWCTAVQIKREFAD